MSKAVLESSSISRWRRPSANVVSYATVARQSAAAMAETSATPLNIPIQGPGPKPKLIRKPARPVIRIHGEPFHVERDEGVYYIVHDRWSLMGSGDSLAAAYKDLFYEATEVAPVYTATPLGKLDKEGARLAKFLFRFR
jgi:hypothetical protein